MADKSKMKGSKKKLMKGKGKYAAYRSQNRQTKHKCKRILASQGLHALELYCVKIGANPGIYIRPFIAGRKPHKSQQLLGNQTQFYY